MEVDATITVVEIKADLVECVFTGTKTGNPVLAVWPAIATVTGDVGLKVGHGGFERYVVDEIKAGFFF